METPRQVVVIPPANYVLSGTAQRSGNRWTVHLPAGLELEYFVSRINQVERSCFSGAPQSDDKQIQRYDEMQLRSAADDGYVNCTATEPTALGLAALVLAVVKMPPREALPGEALPSHVRVHQLGGEDGVSVQRLNKDGSWHLVASEKSNPDWRGRPDKARDYARDYVRRIA